MLNSGRQPIQGGTQPRKRLELFDWKRVPAKKYEISEMYKKLSPYFHAKLRQNA